jgi:hypothetical protein
MKLIELVYEGGEILDLCLDSQREYLRSELRERFLSVDLRGQTALERKVVLQRLVAKGAVYNNVLIRGLSGLLEASQFFTRSSLLIDALGRSELPAARELSQWAFRTKRVFAYSGVMDAAIRAAGIGAISRHTGPFFPTVDFGTEGVSNCIGVLGLGRGALIAIGDLKRRRVQEGLEYTLVTTENVPGTVKASSPLEVAERCGLLVAPYDEIDNGGPNEAALLALGTRRVLCTAPTSAVNDLRMDGRLLRAARYEKGSYADAALRYEGIEAYAAAISATRLNGYLIPDEILRRL